MGLNRIKKIEEEARIKQEEAQFESYKKEMEKYLDFVCQDEDSKQTKTKKKVKVKTEEPSKKLKLNIGNIRNQFEEGEASARRDSSAVKSAPANVQKLNPIKIFNDKKEEELKPNKKKEYVPVIIDKAAFERTVGMFEKEKKEEEERKQNELGIKKRRAEMEAERQKLLIEKERHMAEEAERQREKEAEEERERIIAEEEKKQREREEDANKVSEAPPEPPKIDIFEQIKHTLAQIKEDEE